jgi:2-C-methyl-D-erythritol 4-phosphate cytidylyltransferase/2-C-methyl-D-erythritol 2,4-cyclodiphosphate synthase
MSHRHFPGVGLGVDVHRFGGGGPLMLGGVEVPHPQGLVGHSDADVLCHAVSDAVLGAAALGDMGEHFPAQDQRWRGASSLALLRMVVGMLEPLGLQVAGVDATVIAEAPRLGPHRERMEASLREALGLPLGGCSVKIKSSDGLGLTGRQEGMAALAVATVRESSSSAGQ